MLQSFLIVRDRPAAKSPPAPVLGFPFGFDDEEPAYAEGARFDSPTALLDAAGLRAQESILPEPSPDLDVNNIDAILFCTSYSRLLAWTRALEARTGPPLLWWCDNEPVVHNCVLADSVDGILYPGMTTAELHWTLLLSSKHYLSRTQWKQEREQLIAKLEDRKWIDRAKSILSEVKSITEAEAYEFLRKQAMNERRRLVDVAVSIVKVYSLLREQNPRGRSR
ncbi:ANTAR domain-containing protein [Paenibacillus antri]|uniref:ANTAR domain-containing protein n=1 Tax=Paenibacillus antri TaxID=2582848 RepID=A0A5R9GI42_9BACL|nr:ANTAR domain-containing protein [Paenibacillus antri]TLS51185.1 ANTAR domain-containing protein [Paenibacillus antri]